MRRFDHGSGRVNASIAHQDRQQRALGEERAHRLRRLARGALGQIDEIAPRAADGLADLRVVARRPALQHQHQAVAVGHHRLVGVAHRVQRVHPLLPAGGIGEDLVEMVDRAPRRREVELLLRAEEPEEVRLRDAGRPRDVLGRGAVQALDGELVRGGDQDGLAALVGGLAVGRRRHSSEYSLTSSSCQVREPPGEA